MGTSRGSFGRRKSSLSSVWMVRSEPFHVSSGGDFWSRRSRKEIVSIIWIITGDIAGKRADRGLSPAQVFNAALRRLSRVA